MSNSPLAIALMLLPGFTIDPTSGELVPTGKARETDCQPQQKQKIGRV
jgi:hypothetical protein